MTTGPEKAQEAVNDSSTSGPDERDVRETRDEQQQHEAGTMGSGVVDPDVSGPLLTETQQLRSSWQRILAGFVDDPRGSVAQAATMVEETAQTLVATIQEQERMLRGAWEGNGGADTEKLRIALGKYRAFFEKITLLDVDP